MFETSEHLGVTKLQPDFAEQGHSFSSANSYFVNCNSDSNVGMEGIKKRCARCNYGGADKLSLNPLIKALNGAINQPNGPGLSWSGAS